MAIIEDMIRDVWALDLSDEVVEEAIKALADTINVAILGYKRSEVAKAFVDSFNCEGDSLILGSWKRACPLMAAVSNSFLAHSLEFDDWLRAGYVHAGSVVVPTALAFAETWEDLIRGVVIGYEVSARVGASLGRAHYSKWHTTGTAGSFGAAATASYLMGLSEESASHALAVAGYYTSGLWGFIRSGSSVKPFSPAHASFVGLTAAKLAASGVKTNLEVFEDERGICRNMVSECDLRKLVDPGWDYAILLNGYKIYPTCRHTHTAIAAALSLGISEPREVEVLTFKEAMRIAGIRSPKKVDEARFSTSYLVALALLKGRVDLDTIEEGLHDPKVMELESKVVLIEETAHTARYPEEQPATVRVLTRDGWVEETVRISPGDPDNPVSLEDILNKARNEFTIRVVEEARKGGPVRLSPPSPP